MAELKKCPPEKDYYTMDVEKGKTYFWCACAKSKNQPFCDGSHSGTDITPVEYTADESKEVSFCGCRETKTAPMCDGSHKE